MKTREELLLELKKRVIPQELLDIKEKTIQDYNTFFGITLQRKFKVYMINSREEMDIVTKKKTDNWLKGYSIGPEGLIFLFNPRNYEKETGQKILSLEKLLKHEIAHQFYGEIVHSHGPNWLNEGLAEYLAEKQKPNKSIDEIVNCIDFDEYFTVEQYSNSYQLVDLLINKFGKKKLITLIKSFKNKDEFTSAFERIYGFELTKENLIKNLK